MLRIEKALALLTPESCIICQNEGSRWCAQCFWSQFERPEERCYICNKLSRYNHICVSCRSLSRLRRVWWLGSLEGVIKDLVVGMKYGHKRADARTLGRYLAESSPFIPPEAIVTHIPTATSRVRQRGYDQAKVVATEFARTKKLQYTPLLRRQGQVELVGKSRRERMRVMSQALAPMNKKLIAGKSIIVIDDVLTSGASLEAAAATLRSAGAAHVDGAVVARGIIK